VGISSSGSSVSVGVGTVAVTVGVRVGVNAGVALISGMMARSVGDMKAAVWLAGAGGELKTSGAGELVIVATKGNISRRSSGPQAAKTRERQITNRKNRYFKGFSLSY